VFKFLDDFHCNHKLLIILEPHDLIAAKKAGGKSFSSTSQILWQLALISSMVQSNPTKQRSTVSSASKGMSQML
jgi:hypothetical protein